MLIDDFLQYVRDVASSGLTDDDERIIVAACEDALEELENMRDWNAYKDVIRLNLIAPLDDGTVSGSGTAVTGVGTSFDDAGDPDSTGAGGQLFVVAGEPFFHRIASVTNATAMVLEANYQNLSATSFSGEDYQIFFDTYTLPSTVKDVKAVIDVEFGPERPLQDIRHTTIQTSKARSTFGGRPVAYNIDQAVAAGEEVLKIALDPAPDQTYLLDIVVHKHISDLPTTGDTTNHIDVPPYLFPLFKALVIQRLGLISRRWENALQLGTFDVAKQEKRAVAEDTKHEPPIIIRYRQASSPMLYDPWDVNITWLGS